MATWLEWGVRFEDGGVVGLPFEDAKRVFENNPGVTVVKRTVVRERGPWEDWS